MKRWLFSLVALAIVLTGCRSSPPTPTPTWTTSPAPTLTPTPPPDLSARPGAIWNFELIGHHPIHSTNSYGGLALAGNYAYIGSYTPTISIIDISNPASPSLAGTISLEPGARPVEVRTLPDRNLLIVADLGTWKLLIYDISDGTKPTPLASLDLAGSPHEFFLWRDNTQVLAYVCTFDTGPPNLLVIDLTDPAKPREVGRWTAGDDGVAGILHSVSVSRDGSTAYLCMWRGGFVVADVGLPRITVKRDSQGNFAPVIFTNTHSAVVLSDPRYVLLASEVFDCPFNGLAIVDIGEPSHPQIISQFTLPENRCQDLPSSEAVFTPHNPLVVGNLAFISWYAAGVQAVDLTDPHLPKGVGQFVPTGEGAVPGYLGSYPVQTFSYPIVRNGLLYVVDSASGLYVLRYTGPGTDKLAAVPLAEGNMTILP